MSGWSVEIEQWDEDGFHGKHSWHTDDVLRGALYRVALEAFKDAHHDTRKLVITIGYMERPFLSTKEIADIIAKGQA